MDRYIDNAETQTYGPALIKNLQAAFDKSDPATKKFVASLAARQRAADTALAASMADSRSAGADVSAAAADKAPQVAKARRLLSGLEKHLGAQQDLGTWSGKLKTFLPRGVSDLGGARDVLSALGVARAALAADPSVPGAKKLGQRLAAAEKSLSPLIDKSGGARRTARSRLSSQSKQRKAWLSTYHGIALITEGLLKLDGREKRLHSIVPHLSAPSGRRTKKK